ncbi:RICIN domain-containing protein [Streptomyces sp. NPDC050636]|uniref:RICIN domain-containing protein n=1 Tax=Streptomyces sp. NPDC050636 TaxID=3154510 RepID=UPI003424D702
MWTSLEPAAITVDPGSVASVRLRVRNTGDTVEEYRLRPAGTAAGWTRVEPDVLRLYPGAEGTAEVEFAPPRTPDAVAGPTPFGIRVEPAEHPEIRDVVEGQVTVGPFAELRCELVPLAVRGRWRAKAAVAVDNLGNQPLTVSLSGRENGDALTVEPEPTSVQVAPGRAAFVQLNIRPGTVSWIGGTTKHPFTVAAQCAGVPEPSDLRGTYIQPSVLPRWAMAVCSLLVVAALAFVALWFKAVPKVPTSAREKPGQAHKLPEKGEKPPSPPPPKPTEEAPAEKPADGDGEEKKPLPPNILRSHANMNSPEDSWYLNVFQGKQGQGTMVSTANWSYEKYGRNQWWTIHHFEADNTVALQPGNAPGSVLDLDVKGNGVGIWPVVGGAEALQNGQAQLPDNQKWRMVEMGGANTGYVQFVNVANNQCLREWVGEDRPVRTEPCTDDNVWEQWYVGTGLDDKSP